RGGGLHFRAGQLVLADSAARRDATDRWATDEPVLAALAEALGIERGKTDDSPAIEDDTATVLAAVHDALMELEAVRQRRAIEKAAFDNVWRGQ
ncbi:MAG TPA: GPP34 family phosphoprotein, partial [Streptomyces sp.]